MAFMVSTSDTKIEDLLRDSPLADESAVAGIQSKVEDVLQGGEEATGGDKAG